MVATTLHAPLVAGIIDIEHDDIRPVSEIATAHSILGRRGREVCFATRNDKAPIKSGRRNLFQPVARWVRFASWSRVTALILSAEAAKRFRIARAVSALDCGSQPRSQK